MRILLLSNLYPPYIQGGAEITAGDIAAGLTRLGHDVTVLTSWYDLPAPQREDRVWRTLYYAGPAHFNRRDSLVRQVQNQRSYYRQYHYPFNARELLRAISQVAPDILYIWEINGVGIISLLKALQKLTTPIVFHLGSYWWQYIHSPQTEHSQVHLRQFKQILIGRVPPLPYTSLIAVSGAVKQEYIKAGCNPQRIEIINSGIDPRFVGLPRATSIEVEDGRDNPYAKKELTQLIFAGRIRAEKGVLVILKTLGILIFEHKRRDLHLNIFGDGDQVYINQLKQFLEEKQLTPFVTFHGKVTQDKLIAFYDLSDIMLMPSLWQEPFGLVIAEAMARGLPVIASNLGGPAEIIRHNTDGLLVVPGDECALASAITQLLEHPELRERLVRVAHETVKNRFTIAENISLSLIHI